MSEAMMDRRGHGHQETSREISDAALVKSLGVDLAEDIITGVVGEADLWEVAQEIGTTPKRIYRAIDREITRGNL